MAVRHAMLDGAGELTLLPQAICHKTKNRQKTGKKNTIGKLYIIGEIKCFQRNTQKLDALNVTAIICLSREQISLA